MSASDENSPGRTSPVSGLVADPGPQDGRGLAASLKIIGGLLALTAGLVALLVVLIIAKGAGVRAPEFTGLATTVIGVIGSTVGAYFGVKIGSDGTQKALESQRQESARAQVYAAHMDPAVADKALGLAFPGEPPSGPPEHGAGQAR